MKTYIPWHRGELPYLTVTQMIEVDRAIAEDYRIDLVRMTGACGRGIRKAWDPSRAGAIGCESSARSCSKGRNDGNDKIVPISEPRKGVISVPDSMIRICRHQ